MRLAYCCTPANAPSQHVNAEAAIVLTRTIAKLVEIDGMLECTILDETALRDVLIVFDQAHGETEVRFGIRIQITGAKQHDVSQAYGRQPSISNISENRVVMGKGDNIHSSGPCLQSTPSFAVGVPM